MNSRALSEATSRLIAVRIDEPVRPSLLDIDLHCKMLTCLYFPMKFSISFLDLRGGICFALYRSDVGSCSCSSVRRGHSSCQSFGDSISSSLPLLEAPGCLLSACCVIVSHTLVYRKAVCLAPACMYTASFSINQYVSNGYLGYSAIYRLLSRSGCCHSIAVPTSFVNLLSVSLSNTKQIVQC